MTDLNHNPWEQLTDMAAAHVGRASVVKTARLFSSY